MKNAQKNNITREELRRTTRVLAINDGDVLALKEGSRLANTESIKKLSKVFALTGRKNVVIVVVADLDDFSVLSERQMQPLGWRRITEVAS